MSYTNRNGAQGTAAAMRASNPSAERLPVSIAHNAASVSTNLSHAVRHAARAATASDPSFDVRHTQNHLALASEDHGKLIGHLRESDPAIAAELDALAAAVPDAPDAPSADSHEGMTVPA